MKIVVASKNPVKLNAARLGFETYFDNVEVKGIEVESGVSDQPKSDAETLAGAENRVNIAKQNYADAAFWIGIEGGIEYGVSGIEAFAWIVIKAAENYGRARTTSFQLPPQVAEYIKEGYELGEANDIVFNQVNSKQKSGAVGLLTNGKVSRTVLYKQAVELALIPFLNHKLY
ncbi:inosine/xanthosine triphosphatase [uncultured Draconibacterium sp.]|uniref:inosine/xanthosine triphosphatase n=1 Tax=uncultured Draconibacterium sp. TaxID=1573823 RepID=UPI0032618255